MIRVTPLTVNRIIDNADWRPVGVYFELAQAAAAYAVHS